MDTSRYRRDSRSIFTYCQRLRSQNLSITDADVIAIELKGQLNMLLMPKSNNLHDCRAARNNSLRRLANAIVTIILTTMSINNATRICRVDYKLRIELVFRMC